MGERYEMVEARHDCAVHVGPGSDFGHGDVLKPDQHALVLGDPDATALVVIGHRDELASYLRSALAALEAEPETWGPCPACGDPDGPCELGSCGDPECLSRDCECHDACETKPAVTA